MDLLLYLSGGALLVLLVRWWRPEVSVKAAAGYVLAAGLFFGAPLATSKIQVPTDIAYFWMPWAETLPGPTVPKNPVLGDIPSQMIPYRDLVRRRLLDFEVPLWAHEMGTGQPLLGNAQSAPFAPLHLMALPVPTVRALTVAVAWQVLLALLLTDALARALGAGRWGAPLAAVAFAFSTFEIAWAYHPIGMTVTWIPGVLLGLFLLRRGGRGAFAGLVACATGMALSGHPESLAHMAAVCGVLTAALLLGKEEAGWPSRKAFLVRLAGAGALTFCLSAPFLLPIVEVVPQSERWVAVHRVPDLYQTPRFRPTFLLPLIDPLVFGSTRDANWDGFSNFNEICSGYAGAVTLALAIAGALVLRGRPARLMLGGLAALLIALRLPPLFQVISLVPGLEHAMHGRFRLFWVLAVALAAGLSLEELMVRGWKVAAALILGLYLALQIVRPPSDLWQQLWWVGALTGMVVAFVVLVRREARPVFPAVALTVLALDLALLGIRYHPILPSNYDLTPPPALAYLIEDGKAEPGPFRVLAESGDLLPNLASYYGLWDPRGNDPMQPAAPVMAVGSSFLPHFKVGRLVHISYQRFPRHLKPRFDYFGVKYMLERHRRRLPKPWQAVFNGMGGRVWKNPDAMPLFFMPARIDRAPGPSEALARMLANEDFAGSAVVEAPDGPSVSQQGRVKIAAVRANGFELEVDSPTGGLVASSVSHTAGWRLERDGEEGSVVRVNAGFVGFEVPPGRHRVTLDYRPAGWTWGLQLFALGLIGMLIAAYRSLRPQHLDRPALQGAGAGGETGQDGEDDARGERHAHG
ncbi:MAG: YfhO family protein [Acidobacteriota bacterium]